MVYLYKQGLINHFKILNFIYMNKIRCKLQNITKLIHDMNFIFNIIQGSNNK